MEFNFTHQCAQVRRLLEGMPLCGQVGMAYGSCGWSFASGVHPGRLGSLLRPAFPVQHCMDTCTECTCFGFLMDEFRTRGVYPTCLCKENEPGCQRCVASVIQQWHRWWPRRSKRAWMLLVTLGLVP